MSLEALLAENTIALDRLTAALEAAGAIATASTPNAKSRKADTENDNAAVKAVVKAQKELAEKEAKKPEAVNTLNTIHPPVETSGEASTPAQATESAAAVEVALQPWAEKTAALYGQLKDGEPSLDNVRKAVLGINSLLGQPAGREQATALLGRFGAKAVTFKPEIPDKPGLNADQFPAVFAMALEVLAGRLDVTASMEGAA